MGGRGSAHALKAFVSAKADPVSQGPRYTGVPSSRSRYTRLTLLTLYLYVYMYVISYILKLLNLAYFSSNFRVFCVFIGIFVIIFASCIICVSVWGRRLCFSGTRIIILCNVWFVSGVLLRHCGFFKAFKAYEVMKIRFLFQIILVYA